MDRVLYRVFSGGFRFLLDASMVARDELALGVSPGAPFFATLQFDDCDAPTDWSQPRDFLDLRYDEFTRNSADSVLHTFGLEFDVSVLDSH